jgi:hypothetical protein
MRERAWVCDCRVLVVEPVDLAFSASTIRPLLVLERINA